MSAVDQVVAAFTRASWVATKQERVSGGRTSNPTRLDLARGKQHLKLLVYAWKITGEGKGRAGDNYRIQTTRSHEGDLLTEVQRLTIGFGIDQDRGVIAAFDGWTKRATGSSSSVHIERQTLDRARDEGYAEQMPLWDSRVGTRLDDIDRLLGWISRQRQTRTAGFEPLEFEVDGPTAVVRADLWASSPAAWLRQGDQLFLADRSFEQLRDPRIWTVRDVSVTITNPGHRYPRRTVTFGCTLHGRVNNPDKLLREARTSSHD
jgi:hypothetical protein